MYLLSKLTSEICPKIRGLVEKVDQNRLKIFTFSPCLEKKNYFNCWKMKNTSRLCIVKISVSTNFMCLRQKVLLEICQKVVSLDLRIALTKDIFRNRFDKKIMIIK